MSSLFGGGNDDLPKPPTPTPPPAMPEPFDPVANDFSRRKAMAATRGGMAATKLTRAAQTIGGGAMGGVKLGG